MTDKNDTFQDLEGVYSNNSNNQMIDLNNATNDLPTLASQIVSNESGETKNSNDNNIIELKEPKNDNQNQITSSDQNEGKKDVDPAQSYINKLLCIFSFIRPYFKVTYKDVKERIISSFMPINNLFFDIANNTPDLYGPFWIYTTLIYVIAAGGALSYYFTNSSNYFQLFVPIAGTILYSFGFGFPFLLWLCMKIFNIGMKYVCLICIYGYSLSCFIPVLVICSCGFGWIQWLFLTYGILNSTAFILINLWNFIKDLENRKKYAILGIIVSCQFIFYLTLKLYFFGSFSAPNQEQKTADGQNTADGQKTSL